MLALSPGRLPRPRDFVLPATGRTLVMGIVNVTPDSFSDGGRFLDAGAALRHAGQLKADGADILDIGAESTRPYGGMKPVDADEELARLSPVLSEAVKLGVPVSADTNKARVAAWALERGAVIVNDVCGFQGDPDMARVAAESGAMAILMHNRTQVDDTLDIVADMRAFFTRSLEIADRAGVKRERIMLDPGIGFGKTPRQSLVALARLEELHEFGRPLLVGLSRKRFIDSVSPAAPERRIGGSIVGNMLAVLAGAAIVRVHDVFETVQALRVAQAIRDAR